MSSYFLAAHNRLLLLEFPETCSETRGVGGLSMDMDMVDLCSIYGLSMVQPKAVKPGDDIDEND